LRKLTRLAISITAILSFLSIILISCEPAVKNVVSSGAPDATQSPIIDKENLWMLNANPTIVEKLPDGFISLDDFKAKNNHIVVMTGLESMIIFSDDNGNPLKVSQMNDSDLIVEFQGKLYINGTTAVEMEKQAAKNIEEGIKPKYPRSS